MKKFKQVLVMRKSFPGKDGNPRKLRTGKYIAQAAHASMGVIFDHFMKDGKLDMQGMEEWFVGHFTKVAVGVEDEAGLMEIHQAALKAGLPVKLIQDSGTTEFDGIVTATCLAIGPARCEEIDKITGHLSLM